MLAPVEEDEGYVSPDFDLPSDSASEEEEELTAPPAKRAKGASSRKDKTEKSNLADYEELAIRLLHGTR